MGVAPRILSYNSMSAVVRMKAVSVCEGSTSDVGPRAPARATSTGRFPVLVPLTGASLPRRAKIDARLHCNHEAPGWEQSRGPREPDVARFSVHHCRGS